MSDKNQLKLDRQILSKFLPTHEAVVAFERLFLVSLEQTPQNIEDLSVILSLIRAPNTGTARIEERILVLEGELRSARRENSSIKQQISSMETMLTRNKSEIESLVRIVGELKNYLGV